MARTIRGKGGKARSLRKQRTLRDISRSVKWLRIIPVVYCPADVNVQVEVARG